MRLLGDHQGVDPVKNRIISLLLLLLMLSLPVMGEEEVSLFSPGGNAPAQAETLPALALYMECLKTARHPIACDKA